MAEAYENINLKDSNSLESTNTTLKDESTAIIEDLKNNIEYIKSCINDDVWQGKSRDALNNKLVDLMKANEIVETKFKDFDEFLSTTLVLYKNSDTTSKNESDNLSDGN